MDLASEMGDEERAVSNRLAMRKSGRTNSGKHSGFSIEKPENFGASSFENSGTDK